MSAAQRARDVPRKPLASSRAFLVHVAQLRKEVGARTRRELSGAIDDLFCAGTFVPPGTEVGVDVVLESVPGGVVVTGTVETSWAGQCRRCLGPASGAVRIAVRELFVESHRAGSSHQHGRERPGVRRAGGAGRAVGAGGPPRTGAEDLYEIDGDDLDLEPMARDAVLLELPLAPLCRAECRGLCPKCGADLNLAASSVPPESGEPGHACSCEPDVDPRWSALDALEH